jgi:hypothetical protein
LVAREGLSSLGLLLSLGAFSSWLCGATMWRTDKLEQSLEGVAVDSEQKRTSVHWKKIDQAFRKKKDEKINQDK